MKQHIATISLILLTSFLTSCFKSSHLEVLNLTPHQLVENRVALNLMLISEQAPDSLTISSNQDPLATHKIDLKQWKGQGHLWKYPVQFPASLSGKIDLHVEVYSQGQVIEEILLPVEVVQPRKIEHQLSKKQILEIESFLVNDMAQFVVDLGEYRQGKDSLWWNHPEYIKSKQAILSSSAPQEWMQQFKYYSEGFEQELSVSQLMRRTDSLNLWLSERSLPYQITLFETRYEDKPAKSIILSYEILRTLNYEHNSQILPTNSLNRMDHLNQSELLLGHVSRGISQAVVLNYKISNLGTLMATCLSYHESQCAKIFQSEGEYNFPSDRGETSELAALVRLDWESKYPSQLPITTAAADLMEDAQIRAVGYHEARHLLHRREGLSLAKSMNQLLRKKNKKNRIRLEEIEDIDTKIHIMRKQYAYASRHNSEFAAYLGTLAESPDETYFQLFSLYHQAISSLYRNTTEQMVARVILGELAIKNKLIEHVDLNQMKYDYWIELTSSLMIIDEQSLRAQAEEIYREQFGDMKKIQLNHSKRVI